jgi:hypothetical protein
MFSCDKVITIPQTSDICWFNAILMAIFYSQYSRKLLYHNFEGKKDKFSRIMNDIIKHNYIRTGQVIKYFEFMKPQNILKYINVDKTDLLKEFKTRKSYNIKNIETFLALFLNSLGKNILDIIALNFVLMLTYYLYICSNYIIISKQLFKSKILYEESTWFDINTWTKPVSMIRHERLINEYLMKPVIKKLQSLIFIISVLIVLNFSYLIVF